MPAIKVSLVSSSVVTRSVGIFAAETLQGLGQPVGPAGTVHRLNGHLRWAFRKMKPQKKKKQQNNRKNNDGNRSFIHGWILRTCMLSISAL